MNASFDSDALAQWPLWLGVASSVVSAVACLTIAAAASLFLRGRADLAPVARRLGWLLVGFLLVAALTHLSQAINAPDGAVEVAARLVTATVSMGAAVLVWPQLPRLLGLPSPRDLARSNAALARTNASLETTIAWRTHELRQANERFETALSRANITVYTQDRDLGFTWVHNPQPGLTPGEGGDGGPTSEAAAEMAREVVETGETASGSIFVTGAVLPPRYYDLLVTPTRDPAGRIDGVLCTAVDVTERRLLDVRLALMAGQVATAYHRFELALENSPISVFEQDRDLRYSFVHNPPPGTGPGDFLGRTDEEAFAAPDARRLATAKQRVMANNARETLGLDLRIGGEARFFDIRLEPKVDAENAVSGVISTAVDLTERQRNEKQMRLVMRELTHRSKNLLAVVQAMARKTASLAPDVDVFIRDFSSRLRAMAASQDLLVAEFVVGGGDARPPRREPVADRGARRPRDPRRGRGDQALARHRPDPRPRLPRADDERRPPWRAVGARGHRLGALAAHRRPGEPRMARGGRAGRVAPGAQRLRPYTPRAAGRRLAWRRGHPRLPTRRPALQVNLPRRPAQRRLIGSIFEGARAAQI